MIRILRSKGSEPADISAVVVRGMLEGVDQVTCSRRNSDLTMCRQIGKNDLTTLLLEVTLSFPSGTKVIRVRISIMSLRVTVVSKVKILRIGAVAKASLNRAP